jgi:hypothetical protein
VPTAGIRGCGLEVLEEVQGWGFVAVEAQCSQLCWVTAAYPT